MTFSKILARRKLAGIAVFISLIIVGVVASLHYSRVSEFLIVEASPSVCDATDDGVSRVAAV